jgi:hypothetical protein
MLDPNTLKMLQAGRELAEKMYGPGVIKPTRLELDAGLIQNPPEQASAPDAAIPVEAEAPVEEVPVETAEEAAAGGSKEDTEEAEPKAKTKAASDGDDLETWKQRYRTVEGKYKKEGEELRAKLASTSSEIEALRRQLAEIQAERDAAIRAAEELNKKAAGEPWAAITELSEETVETLRKGVSATAEAAMNQLKDKIAKLESKLASIEPSIQTVKTQTLETQLDAHVPGWREINVDPTFVNEWLHETDPLSGVPRINFFVDAVNKSDAGRVAAFFKAYSDQRKPAAKEKKAVSPAPQKAQEATEAPKQSSVILQDMAYPSNSMGSEPPTRSGRQEVLTRAHLTKMQEEITSPMTTAERRAELVKRVQAALRDGRIQA